jgi:hypothetical protein
MLKYEFECLTNNPFVGLKLTQSGSKNLMFSSTLNIVCQTFKMQIGVTKIARKRFQRIGLYTLNKPR